MLVQKFVEFSLKHIKKENIKTIVEFGARDCEQTLEFCNFFPTAKIYTFECNPQTLPICSENVKGRENIKLFKNAISEQTGTISFFAIDPEKTKTSWLDGNPGASSLFLASGKYEVEKYVQKKIKVESVRAEEFVKEENLESIDLLWMDIQGGELGALKSFGSFIKNVKIIHTEVEFLEIYKDQPLFWDVKKFLNQNNFYLSKFTSFNKNNSADAIFINKKVINKDPFKIMIYFFNNKTLHYRKHHGFL